MHEISVFIHSIFFLTYKVCIKDINVDYSSIIVFKYGMNTVSFQALCQCLVQVVLIYVINSDGKRTNYETLKISQVQAAIVIQITLKN